MKHSRDDRILRLPSGTLALDRVLVMGILNATPDSFYDGGRYRGLDALVARASAMIEEGADIIDIGGEKAGPGDPVSADEEIRRVVPVLEALRKNLNLPLSVDTFKPAVARAAVEAGADIVNSIGGFLDPGMRQVAADTHAAVVIMHIQGRPRVHNPKPLYKNITQEVHQFLEERIADCREAGIAEKSIIIDPGPDFGKNTEHSMEILRQLQTLTAMQYPLLLAVSRKRFIGDVLGLGIDERLEGSLAVTAWGVMHGARIVRTHDVKATKRVVTMTEAVLHPEFVETEL